MTRAGHSQPRSEAKGRRADGEKANLLAADPHGRMRTLCGTSGWPQRTLSATCPDGPRAGCAAWRSVVSSWCRRSTQEPSPRRRAVWPRKEPPRHARMLPPIVQHVTWTEQYEFSDPLRDVRGEGEEAERLRAELLREVSPDHPLHGLDLRVIARGIPQDEVLVETADERVALVHMTWSGRADSPPWPMTTFLGFGRTHGRNARVSLLTLRPHIGISARMAADVRAVPRFAVRRGHLGNFLRTRRRRSSPSAGPARPHR